MIDSEDRIIDINIEDEMKTAYIDYSMSVIVSRALPDVRDGFKPVHRRVLFAMNETGNTYDKPTRKCANAVGEVLGKYHPHGDSSVYGTLVRMAQPWSLRYPLVDGQGNFGSVDGDSPAAMRYTESRLSKLAGEMLRDIDKETVDFQNNFDDTRREPTVLPTRFPNLLVNGAAGIAVGMATNMPPHNLSECIDGCIAYIDSRETIDVEGLMQYVKAPDFPTGGFIYGYAGVREAFETGRGRVVVRSRCEIEQHNAHERIIVTEIPYQVNKAELVKSIADLISDKKIEGISNISDESNRKGMRIVIDIKRDANASVVLNKLYKMTALQSSFSVNNIALVNGRPQLLNLRDLISAFVDHRHDVVTRRSEFELRKAHERAHILEGLIIAVDNIDEVVSIIRSSAEAQIAIERLMVRFDLSLVQARAIVDMRLRALTGLEQDKLRAEYEELMRTIEHLKALLSDRDLRMQLIREELEEIKERYGDERRSEIIYASEEFNPEDFYADEEMIITISHHGYIKRTPLSEFRSQARGGVGAKGSDTRDEDFIEYIYSASMHATMLLFTQRGRCYWLKVYEIPEGSKSAKGRAIQNLLNIEPGDKVNAFIRIKNLTKDLEFINSHYLIFCTKRGIIKKTLLEAYSRPRTSGVIAINLSEDDSLVSVSLTNGKAELLVANRNGRAVRFHESKVRAIGRQGMGVKGMTLDEDGQDEVIGMISIRDAAQESVLVVSEKGYGKRSKIEDYRITNRGGKGVKTLNITDKTGLLVAVRSVTDEHDLMIINKSGIAIRLRARDLAIIGRATQGVRLINLDKRGDEIASVCRVISEEELQEQEETHEPIIDDSLEAQEETPSQE
ncbi:DNA gyrase subunit A [Porphyromonas sp. COT-239 OH1446]|uniref:DNA gyrase subunit A n=1 Tax=Porphyromonas sp. COT-239 OH1446 TaxID=1515613 RepID=UPI00052C0A08|nr:DNA gyrase subunit A [Porphyromonas sp. COT-239 OH1446]KGN68330.1 DNA gyrase subunit A [Porphyromonas sp. COT-239 OH1446]